MGNHVLHLGVQLVVVDEAAALGLRHDGSRHAVREVLLDAGGQAQDVLLGGLRERDDAAHGGRGVGQRAGLVEDHGVGRGQGLQVLAAAHGHAGAHGLVHGAHHGDGRGELDGARVVHHEHGHCLVDVARHGEDAKERKEAVGHDGVRQALRAALGARLELA